MANETNHLYKHMTQTYSLSVAMHCSYYETGVYKLFIFTSKMKVLVSCNIINTALVITNLKGGGREFTPENLET